jgi:C4-dicarboxylate transporter
MESLVGLINDVRNGLLPDWAAVVEMEARVIGREGLLTKVMTKALLHQLNDEDRSAVALLLDDLNKFFDAMTKTHAGVASAVVIARALSSHLDERPALKLVEDCDE